MPGRAAAGAGVTVGRRVHTVRHGPGRTVWTARLEPEVVGSTGLTTDEPDGTEEHGRQHHRRAFHPNPSQAGVVRQWHGKADGPGGKAVFLTKAVGQQPVQPFDDDADRRLMEHGGSTEAKQPWDLQPPPQNTARAVRGQGQCTLLQCALATASRRPSAQHALGGEPVGWPRWRRQLLEQIRDRGIVVAQGCYGMLHMAVVVLLMGGKRKAVPPGLGTYQDILGKYGLPPER